MVALAVVGCSSGDLASLLGGGSQSLVPAFAILSDFNSLQAHSMSVNTTTGALAEVAGSPANTTVPGDSPWSIVVTPNGKFAYIGDQSSANVETFSINTSTGAIAEVGLTALAATSNAPWITSVAITPDGKYLYVADGVKLDGFSVNASTGALTPLPGFPMTLGADPFGVAVDPLGRFVFVSDDNDLTLYVLALTSSTGALSNVTGSPFDISGSVTSAEGVTVDALGRFVYVTNFGGNKVAGWTVSAAGLLTSTGTPATTGTGPFQLLVEPTGKFAYELNANSGGSISEYSIAATTGVLSPLAGSPFTVSGRPQGGAVDPSGKFLYYSDCTNNKVAGTTIGSTGQLTAITGSPFTAGASYCGGVAVTAKQ